MVLCGIRDNLISQLTAILNELCCLVISIIRNAVILIQGYFHYHH